MVKWIIVGLAIASFIPIFRGYGHSRYDGVCFWEFTGDMLKRADWTADEGWPHIAYSEARRRARFAYVHHHGNQ